MRIGTVVAGRYTIRSVIGRGGMGQVWLARDEHLQRTVALKTMAPDPDTDPERAAQDGKRFAREAMAVARLDHAGLAAVYDLGEENGAPYLVMQYVPGMDLADLIAERERLSAPAAASVATQIASVLASAHSHDIVHRDLKPGNVRVRPDGAVKVLDFGVAAVLDPGITKLTTTGETLGSWLYMAPEQVEGERVDPRTDLYALGCLLHEMLSGEPPFQHESPLMVPDLHRTAAPVPLSQLVPEVPTALEALVLRLLAKKPAERPAHAGEVYVALAPFLPPSAVPERALVPWAEVDPERPFSHPMAPDARAVRTWARQGGHPG